MYWLKLQDKDKVIYIICAEISLSVHVSSRSFRHWHHTVCALLSPVSTLDCIRETKHPRLTWHPAQNQCVSASERPRIDCENESNSLKKQKKKSEEISKLRLPSKDTSWALLSTINKRLILSTLQKCHGWPPRNVGTVSVFELFWKWSVHGCKSSNKHSKNAQTLLPVLCQRSSSSSWWDVR